MTRARTLAAACLLGGCSSLAPTPPEVECVVDADCSDEDLVCDQGVCRVGNGKPPIAYIGLDLQEAAGGQAEFRAEVAGCDQEVERVGTAIQALSLPRREIALRLLLGVLSEAPTEEEPMPPPVDATFTLSQRSRFARDSQRRQVTYALTEETDERTVTVPWPRYLDDNDLPSHLGQGGYLVWETQPLPIEDAPPRALRYQHLSPPATSGVPCATDLDCCPEDTAGTCEAEDVRNACVTSLGECRNPFDDGAIYTYVYNDDCDRPMRGAVKTVDPATLDELGPLAGASITIRHADEDPRTPRGLPRLDEIPLAERASECTSDAACADGLHCNTDTEQCELPLAGRTAWTGTVPSEPEPGEDAGRFDARVYTYCEGEPTTAPALRALDVTVTPPEQLGLPTVTLQANVSFDPIQFDQKPTASFGGDLCVPAMGAVEDVALTLSSAPRELLPGYTCCDIDCLPRTAEDAVSEPPDAPNQCDGTRSGSAPTFRAETPLVLEEAELAAWNADGSGCVPLAQDEDGTVGVLRRSGACETDTDEDTETAPARCALRIPSASDGEARTYALRIETPTGSVSGSLDTELPVRADAGATVVDIALPERVLVHGRVIVADCNRDTAPESDCGSQGAQILAERLRLEGESTENVPGPYFHQVSTFYDPTQTAGERAGAYVLPLDPGMWVVTALPDSGTAGGPARILLLDLRDPPERERLDFLLEPGVLVTVDVDSFDRRSRVIPLDTGSWRLPTAAQLLHPDRQTLPAPQNLLDLGAPGECLSADGADVGCRIRRLVSGSALPPTQIGQVRFTTRDLDTDADVVCP